MPTKEIEITPDMVVAVWSGLQAKYGSRVIRKEDSALMVVVANALTSMGVLDRAAFLTRFTTTLLTDIYAPFVPGVPTPMHDLWSQLVIGVHEHVHVLQYQTDPAMFPIRYLGSKAERAAYEATAYGTRCEMEFWRYGEFVTPAREIATHILSYGCGDPEVEVLNSYLAAFQPTIRERYINEPTVVAVDLLDRMAA